MKKNQIKSKILYLEATIYLKNNGYLIIFNGRRGEYETDAQLVAKNLDEVKLALEEKMLNPKDR